MLLSARLLRSSRSPRQPGYFLSLFFGDAMAMKATLRRITPELAKAWLGMNFSNRIINQKYVQFLVKEIVAGRWRVNGETIILSDSKLIDGQHRLTAVVQSGIAIECLVVEGVSSDAFETVDTGRKRDAADALSILGEKNTSELAATVGMVRRYMTGQTTGRFFTFSNTEIIQYLAEHPGIRQSVSFCKRTKLLPPRVLFACHYLFSLVDQKAADDFANDLVVGSDLEYGSPIFVLRERLVKNSLSNAKLSYIYVMAITIKAWNAMRKGVNLKCLKWEDGTEFPVIL